MSENEIKNDLLLFCDMVSRHLLCEVPSEDLAKLVLRMRRKYQDDESLAERLRRL